MTVELASFDVPVAECFLASGVAFDATTRYECPGDRQLTLMSVCRSYPGAVRICLADSARAARLQPQSHRQHSAEP